MAFKLTHPDSKQEIEVEREHLDAYLSQGWQGAKGAKLPVVEDVPQSS